MNKVTKAILAISLTIIVLSIGFIGGFATSRIMPADSFVTQFAQKETPESVLAGRVDEVYRYMEQGALIPPTESSATAGAIQGLLSSMGDKYASYFDKTHYKAFNEVSQGSFGGIGVVLAQNKDKAAYVSQVYKDTPAYKAGMRAGDVFKAINGVRRPSWLTTDVVKRVRGDIGTTVTVTVLRPTKPGAATGAEHTYTLTRAAITYPNITSKMYGKVGYMRLGQFNANSEKDVSDAVKKLTQKGATSLVLDLRENPGGLLEQAVDVSSLFVSSGPIVRVDERNKPEQVLIATGRKMTDLPLVVLIDKESASASEITGGALQDYGRATLVGTKSFGKGSVQTVQDLSWGGGIKYTIAHYLTPQKHVINGKGLTPDVLVNMDPMKQQSYKTDIQLQKALQIANQKAAGK